MENNILKVRKMTEQEKMFEAIQGNNYKICFEEEGKGERWIFGTVDMFCGTRLIVWCGEDNGFYTIPFNSVRWMIPNGLSRQKKEKLEKQQFEESVKKVEQAIKDMNSITGQKPIVVAKKEVLKRVMDDLEWDDDSF